MRNGNRPTIENCPGISSFIIGAEIGGSKSSRKASLKSSRSYFVMRTPPSPNQWRRFRIEMCLALSVGEPRKMCRPSRHFTSARKITACSGGARAAVAISASASSRRLLVKEMKSGASLCAVPRPYLIIPACQRKSQGASALFGRRGAVAAAAGASAWNAILQTRNQRPSEA